MKELMESMLSKQNRRKLEINNRRKFKEFKNMQKLNNTFLNNQEGEKGNQKGIYKIPQHE